MTIDPRLMERRREVAEDRARRTVSRLIKFMVLLAIVGVIAWALLSPMLSVHEVRTAGIVSSAAQRTLVDEGLLPGTPMVFVRPGKVEAALEMDPWVRDASVELDWPNRVVVKVEERVPLAWVEVEGGWERTAVDGVALYSTSVPDAEYPHIQVGGDAESDPDVARLVLGSLEFVDSLPPELASAAVVTLAGNGELWATVGGYDVRLGRATEMEAKALSLAALLHEEIPQGSVLTMIAPAHPAVTPPETSPDSGATVGTDGVSDGSGATDSGGVDTGGSGSDQGSEQP
ncbi:MAG: FtsQ-type POTRA domain-containing protein [Acidimicrobiia bacterium]